MKKLILAALAATTLGTSVFADVSFHFGDSEKKGNLYFSNELSSDIVHYIKPKNKNKDSHTAFAGLKEEVIAEYLTDKLSLGVDASFSMKDMNGIWNDNDDEPFYVTDWVSDFYVEFMPWNVCGFGFSDELYTAGSYLPVWGDNVSVGNYSTNGVSFLIRPTKEFTFGAGFDLDGYWFGDSDSHHNKYNIAFGIDYDTKDFAIGGSIRGIGSESSYDSFKAGIYLSLRTIKSLELNLGFTHADDGDAGLGSLAFLSPYNYWDSTNNQWISYIEATGIYGKNIFTAGLKYDAKSFLFAADLAFNFDGDYVKWSNMAFKGAYDLYGAVDFLFGRDNIGLDIKGFILWDLGDETVWGTNGWRSLDSTIGIYPKITLEINKNHSIAGGLIFQLGTDSDYGYTEFALPVSWKYVY